MFAPLVFTAFASALNVRADASRDSSAEAQRAKAEGDRAVERARYAFVLEAHRPFDEVYPPSIFQAQARREVLEERILRERFGMSVTPDILSTEFDRIERETRARDQWDAIKQALGGDRGRVEEIFCRPLLVERALLARFAFDQEIHAAVHEKARRARAEFLAGREPSGARLVVLSRVAEATPSTEEMLSEAKAESLLPRKIEASVPPSAPPRDARPIPLEAEIRSVLERELKSPGDVTTILEERKGFEVYRLVERTPSAWRVAAVSFVKVDFDSWFERQAAKIDR